ncbi:hypothetical protein Tco_1100920 [Tanacetum coccineum]
MYKILNVHELKTEVIKFAAPQIRPIDRKQEVPQEGPMCDLLWYGNVAAQYLELDAFISNNSFVVFEADHTVRRVLRLTAGPRRDEAFNFGTPKSCYCNCEPGFGYEGTPGLSKLSPDTTVDGSTIGDHELLSGMSSTVTEIQNEQHMNAPGQNSVTSVKSVTKALKYLVQMITLLTWEIASLWNDEGSFLFTSSSTSYDRYNNGQCYEDSLVVPIGKSPRMDILLKAEKNVLDAGGCVARLARLYISFCTT